VPTPLRLFLAALALAVTLAPNPGAAQIAAELPPFVPSYDDWGEHGLLQTPVARTGTDGDIGFTYSHVHPYDRYNLFFTALPWLETGFRYTAITNRPYGPANPGQSYKDKSFDLKIRLAQESGAFPEVAVGFRDLAGTGLFSGEYLVLNRRYYDFDVSAGMGWGYLSSQGTFANPLSALAHAFKVRPTSSGAGGFTLDYFRGPKVALFGGVEYHTPIEGLRLKLEYDPSDYKSEPLGNSFKVSSPVNFGVVYRPYSFVDVSAGLERGNTFMLRVSLDANFNSFGLSRDSSKPPALTPRPLPADPVGRTLDQSALPRIDTAAPVSAPAIRAALPSAGVARAVVADGGSVAGVDSEQAVATRIFADLAAIGFRGEYFSMQGQQAWLGFSQEKYHVDTIAIGRAARIVARHAPPEIERITLDQVQNGLVVTSLTLMRRDLENAVAESGSPEEVWQHATLAGADLDRPPGVTNRDAYPYYDFSLNPRLRQELGGPDAFIIYQLYAELAGTAHLAPGLSVDATLGANLFNNLNQLHPEPQSELPHVRSDIASYLKDGKTGIFQLEADKLFTIAPDWYGRVSGGLLEYMYAGLDGEILYRPYDQRWAVGLDVNHLFKRGFNELFGVQSYHVTEGQLSFYYRLPFYDLTAALRVGRYLAGDKGATIELSREFAGGVRAGVFATKTNVSAAQFGEGSFDKGFFISFPLDLLLANPSRNEASYIFRPLTRDGGQYLNIAKPLYPMTSDDDSETLSREWPRLLQ
jgi:hypothetical protein